ncbi:MAG: hypothetical protein ACI9KN_002271, partial [Gammaproteobacteria bacterium]
FTIAASAPCWCASPVDPHVCHIHCGSLRGSPKRRTALLSQKKITIFRDARMLITDI